MRSYLEASSPKAKINQINQFDIDSTSRSVLIIHCTNNLWKTYIGVTITKLASSEIVSKGTKTFGSVSYEFCFCACENKRLKYNCFVL